MKPHLFVFRFSSKDLFKVSGKKIKEIQKLKSPSATWWRNCDFFHFHHQSHLFQCPKTSPPTCSSLLHTPTCHPAHSWSAAVPKGHTADKTPWHTLSLAGTHLHPSPPHATDFSDISSYFRYVQLVWNRPKLRNHWMKTQASSPSVVAPLQTITALPNSLMTEPRS